MSIFGIGLKLAFFTVVFMIVGFLPSIHYEWLNFNLSSGIFYFACFWLFVGILLFLFSIYTLLYKFYDGKLITSGVYKYSRNPLYASFIVFIIPAFCLLSGSIPLLSTPIFMYFLFKWLIKEEEEKLTEIFGDEYINYCKKTRILL